MTSEKVRAFEGTGRGPKVAVLGGGVAGMSAAHELIERGFRVAVFERQTELCGGKARSIPSRSAVITRSVPTSRVKLAICPESTAFASSLASIGT